MSAGWLEKWATEFVERYRGRDYEPLSTHEIFYEMTDQAMQIDTLQRRVKYLEEVIQKLGVG